MTGQVGAASAAPARETGTPTLLGLSPLNWRLVVTVKNCYLTEPIIMANTTVQLRPEIVTLNQKQQLAIYARDLTNFLEVPTLGNVWIRSIITELGFVEGLDYCTDTLTIDDCKIHFTTRDSIKVQQRPGKTILKTDYYLSLPMAYAVCLFSNTVLGQYAARHMLELIEQSQAPQIHIEIIQDELWKARKDWQQIFQYLAVGMSVTDIAKRMKRSRRSIQNSIERMRMTCLLVEGV
jgi:phage anti-repressor protein